jgi:putative oxidoreductase
LFNFDLHNGYVLLRLMCGLFMIPHALGKISNKAAVTGFFEQVGFRPAPVWVLAAMVSEWIFTIGLILGLYTRIVAAIAAIFMFVAAAANHRFCKGKWLWNIGGSEYPIFWGLCCVIVALNPT